MTSSFLALATYFDGAGKEIKYGIALINVIRVKYGMLKFYDTYKTVPMQNDEKLLACVPA